MDLDYIIPIYILTTLCIGYYVKSSKTGHQYIFSGRKLTLPAFVMTIVSTWYGGILEIGRFTYENGLATWFVFGFFYYIAALLYAFILAPKISLSNINSIPEAFKKTYGKVSGIIVAFILIFIISPAPYLKILSTIINHLYSFGEVNSIILSCLLSMLYVLKGGIKSVVNTDKFQFILMYLGFFFVLLYLYTYYGGYTFIYSNLQNDMLSIPGKLNWSYIFVWGFIAMITFIDPNLYHRTYSAKSKYIIQKGFILSIGLWFIFDFMSISIGLYCAAILTDINTSPYLDRATTILPPLLGSFFILSMLSIVISTLDSFMFLSGVTIGKDILMQLISSNTSSIYYTRIGIVLSAAISIILSIYFKNALDIWYVTGSFAVSSILIPLIGIFINKKTYRPITTIALPVVTTSIWFLYAPYQIDPMYPGIAVSIISFFTFLSRD